MVYNASEQENKVLKFWDEDKTFEKSVESRPKDNPYVFYDGPPFATGLPHYGHIIASLMKDVVPRYWTMQGKRVERRWGWDCHGLPVENIIEKDLKLKDRQAIEDMGIGKFNEACCNTVLKYAEEWKTTIKRMGRWVDMSDQDGSASGGENYGEHSYKTMDIQYMESVWWVFKELWDKGLIYEGKKSMHVCPRCVTPLSNFEVTQGYKDVKDLSVTAKFKLKNAKEKLDLDGDVYVLAWTTTPWTLPGNVLLAVGGDVEYSVVKNENEYFIIAKDRTEEVMKDKEYEVVKKLKGSDLVDLEYEPLFPYFSDTENAFRVVTADFVTTEDGTGVVHIAPAFGEDDYQVGLRENTGWVQHVTMEGKFTEEATDFVGQEVKPKEDPTKTDVEIIKYLAGKGLLFAKKKIEHSYPHCWRCDTPLLNYSTSSWFVRVTDLKDDLLKNNEKTNWVPDHVKDGRFGKWLEGARDWAISRNRFWGSPLPVWKSEDGDVLCIGSVEELEKLSGKKVEDLHKHVVDEIVITKDGKEYRRIPEVLDCWFESGSMPYGQMHYPFENKEKFEAGYPAEFIAEGQDQTRGWFYTLHVLATALTSGKNPSIPKTETCPAFKNVIVNGIVLAEDGKKMSKRLKNYPDPLEVLEKYGADAMRYYFVSSPAMHSESLNFSEASVREMYNKVINTLHNVFVFYQTFASQQANKPTIQSTNVLDKWILAKLQILVRDVTENMNEYKLAEASRPILDFVTELSQWYVRRSRDRFKGENEEDKQFAIATLREVLLTLSKVMAPFTPFISESIYKEVSGEVESVHLEKWPGLRTATPGEQAVVEEMSKARKIVEMGHSLRKEVSIPVRQPLGELRVVNYELGKDLGKIVAEELNVKNVETQDFASDGEWVTKEDADLKVGLNTEITEELKKEGLVREIVRAINQMRKEQKLTIEDVVTVEYHVEDELLQAVFEDYAEEIKKQTLARDLIREKILLDESDDVAKKIDGKDVLLAVKK
ncbi:MAG: isoleucine--tRNA ligase [Candidatus Magasanikbacteria bacterium]|nr:isoleucine--tRNA ligase [Candidatus Magasanikbacteria bacterium]MBT4315227.1 isoleucine--tRNA ligase [Candidatus Magasanikbacteria bacterium]MBT4547127.1 isoleucine--tRNA ligase [Candidatus Magasanikbacteria bacterium]MBT6819103.1 isoleucine--tRNA ligase [Candidatus Magasanikbacteria bacterium]